MSGLFRRALATLVAVSFVLAQGGSGGAAPSPVRVAHELSVPHAATVALANPPVRAHVPEPPRVRPSMPPASAIRPTVVPGVRPLNGRHVPGPPMLRPSEIDGALTAAAARRHASAAAISVPAIDPAKRSGAPRLPGARPGTAPGTRQAQSLPSNPSGSGTGINPWWRYQEENVPGGGRAMVNVGTGNLLLQDDDMSVPHKGIAMAFRRTYNSQSGHNVNATDAAGLLWEPPGMYGNGWTNTFDAHLVRSTDNTVFSVFDIDGARYDYSSPANGVYVPGPGNHNTLTFDGNCGLLWTKKSGTTYYFYRPNPNAPCATMPASGGSTGGYAGRLYQIIGRNRNTYSTFSYSWDNGNASATGKISAITAQTESGMTSTLTFADVSGHRLLQQLTFPDGATSVSYGYDGNGNLSVVTSPANNPAGTHPVHSYGYAALGSDWVLSWAASPRWNACVPSCGGDGGYTVFGIVGPSALASTFTGFAHVAVVNPVPNDGTNSPLQSGYPSTATVFLYEWYGTGVSTPTFRDSDGHMTNWVVDGTGRPTQTQECTASTNQAQTCTGTWLLLNESWDANDNLVATVDARGYETDYAYDASGNTTAVGEPQTTSSQGTFRPTRLYDYDAFNNVTGYCDEKQTHAGGADWTTPPAPSDTLCASHSAVHARFTFTYPSYEPNGQLATMTTPLGYTRHITYAAAQQGGTDFGLPTSVTGDPFTQLDGTTVTPAQTFWYDAPGNLRCYSKGVGTSVLSYDVLGRMTSVADPDDSSANTGSWCGKASGQSGWNTQTTYTYFSDGSKQTQQTPAERAFGVASSFTYDLDGNLSTQTDHHGCVAGQSCSGGLTRKWYDGADRMVEVAQPNDSKSDSSAWNLRYLYDLSAGAGVSIAGESSSFAAYGNLYKTQSWVPGGWTDQRGSAFDALDREVRKFSYAISRTDLGVGALKTTQLAYDGGSPATLGLLSSKTNPNNEAVTYAYDPLGRVSTQQYAGEGGITPALSFQYDPDGHPTQVSSALYGAQTNTYDDDGRLTQTNEPSGGGLTDPAQLTYAYYANGEKSALSIASASLTQGNAIAYSYRADGQLQTQRLNAFGGGTWNKTYTDAGRPSTLGGAASETFSYDGTGQLVSETLLGGAGLAFTHDPEGSVLSSSEVTNGTTYETLTNGVNQRGELYDQVWNPNPFGTLLERRGTSSAGYLSTVSIPLPSDSNPDATPCSDHPDVLNGTRVDLACPSPPVQWGASSFPQGSDDTFAFDASGRATSHVSTSDTFRSTTIGQRTTNKNTHKVTTSTSVYDAESHLHGLHPVVVTAVTDADANSTTTITTDHGAATIGWGSNGHPLAVQNLWHGDVRMPDTTLHWDGDTLLFVTDSTGAVLDFKVGLDGEIAPHDGAFTGLVAFERDHSGTILGCTSNGVSSPFINPDQSDVPNGVPCLSGNGYTEPANFYFPYIRPDGFGGLPVQINGVRTFDATLGTWTTPDAFEGDVHDPASQQRYMWNRGNAVENEDPTGYASENCQCTDKEKEGEPALPVIGRVTARPFIPPAVAANALDKFNPPGMQARHAPNLLGFAADAALTAVPGGRIEVHHWLPQAFRDFFERRGIDIERYTTRMTMQEHRGKGSGVHYYPYNYNAAWQAWIRENQNATAGDVIDQLNRMTVDPYGIMFNNPYRR